CCSKPAAAIPVGEQQQQQRVEAAANSLQQQKRLFTSYLLWLNPVFPAHHLYLDRLAHALIAFWTLNFLGVGWVVDGFLMRCYVRGFNSQRCSPDAPYDGSRRKLLCHLPLCFVGMLMLGLTTIVYIPTILHHFQVVDIDRIAAQTQVNPYELLEISQSASLQEAKAAYRSKSLQWHPDRNPGCGKECDDKMSEITKAYDLIKRRRAPAPPDRTWEGWLQGIAQDWKHIFEVLGQDKGGKTEEKSE
ncbi:dnaJ, partial [Symbiodinium pilosum]